MRVFFLRHGESVDDVENRFGGWADHPLTERGRKQAEEAGLRIAEQKLVFDAVYSSPLKRAWEAAQAIHRTAKTPLPEICELFKERNSYGILTNLV
ncbi:MAG: phosphoglycerate mutase family protein, partial [Candidatus Micrarchaeota archaeon]